MRNCWPQLLLVWFPIGNKAADEEKKNDCCENVQKENNEKSDEDGTLDESDHSTEDGEKDDDDNHANESNGDGEKKDVSSRQSNRRPRDESPESRRLRKKAVQAAKAEKRLTKIPKHLKKRATKAKSWYFCSTLHWSFVQLCSTIYANISLNRNQNLNILFCWWPDFWIIALLAIII